MHNRTLCTRNRLIGALNQVISGLSQHLDSYVIWDVVVIDQDSNKIKVSLRCRRKSNLNLLVTHLHQKLEHLKLALRAHRVD